MSERTQSLRVRWLRVKRANSLSLLGGLALSWGLAASGCGGTLGGAPEKTGNGDGDGDGDTRTPAGVIGEDDIPSPGTRFRRLSHDEWQNTTADLFGVSSGPIYDVIVDRGGDFLDDPVQGGYIFGSSGYTLEVDSSLWKAYQLAAADIAAAVTSDANALNSIVPAGSSDDARAQAFIEEFGKRAHRRPLTPEQIEQYTGIYELGTTSYLDQSGLAAGVRLLIETWLQSPYFLYRVETSEGVEDGVIPLDSWERASRLSYFFWGTMPDQALFDAASAGQLDDAAGVRTQAQRLVADERASHSVVEFFERVLDVEHWEAAISPSTSVYPGVSPDLYVSATEEATHFLQGVIYENDGSIRDLLTSRTTFVNSELATIYGLDGTFGSTFDEVQLDASERAGVLTQVGFLAANATAVDPDPIHRGVFLAKRVNCIKISAPPDNVPPLPTPSGQSNRQLVEEHTEAEGSTCRNCHSTLINPFGFAYEHYDAIGGFRTEDRTHQVDASTEVLIDDGTVAVANAVELADVLAESPGVHECMSGHLIAYAQGRSTTAEDGALIVDLGSASLESASFRDLMVEMAVADSFINRATEVE